VRGEQVAGQLRGYLDTVLRWPDVTPTLYEFGRHLDKKQTHAQFNQLR
jgi:hypothetical protein